MPSSQGSQWWLWKAPSYLTACPILRTEMARDVEGIIRRHGATPATIAVMQGVPCVGLSPDQLQLLASRSGHVRKTARRDLPHVVASVQTGATTVSATMLLAAQAGISVFVTGGIGGVHRGGESSLDVSSDLTELGRTPVAVVCAGAKSVLDIPRTLEYLETQGVCVAAYGTDEFPAFFSPRSGCQAPARVDSPQQAAQLLHASQRLGLQSGTLFGVPVPEEQAAAGHHLEEATQTALREASAQRIAGHAVTPFLLKRIRELTGGTSLAINLALIKHNASIGAQIAVELSKLQQ